MSDSGTAMSAARRRKLDAAWEEWDAMPVVVLIRGAWIEGTVIGIALDKRGRVDLKISSESQTYRRRADRKVIARKKGSVS